MNKTTEALNLAEEALVYHTQQTRPIQKTEEALAAIREALVEQEKQEPVASVVAMLDKCISIIGTEMNHCKQAGDKWFMCQRFIHAIQDMQYEFKHDYAAPVSVEVEWVDLTDDEIVKVLEYYDDEWDENTFAIAKAIITAIKEKQK